MGSGKRWGREILTSYSRKLFRYMISGTISFGMRAAISTRIAEQFFVPFN